MEIQRILIRGRKLISFGHQRLLQKYRGVWGVGRMQVFLQLACVRVDLPKGMSFNACGSILGHDAHARIPTNATYTSWCSSCRQIIREYWLP